MDYLGFHLTERFINIVDETFIDAMQNSDNFADECMIKSMCQSTFLLVFVYFSPEFLYFPIISICFAFS